MKKSEFSAYLIQLAALLDEHGDQVSANDLRKLTELFDGNPDQQVTQFVAEIRRVRGL